MPIDEIDLPLPGSPFRVRDVLIDYDGPVLFSIESLRLGSIWLLLDIDETPDSTTYLASEVGPTAYQAVALGHRDLRDAFSGELSSIATQALIKFSSLNGWSALDFPLASEPSDDMLPQSGARIRADIASTKEYDSLRLVEITESSNRSHTALEIFTVGPDSGEIEAPLLAQTLGNFQNTVWAIASEVSGTSHQKPQRALSPAQAKHETTWMYKESLAASFVAVLAAPTAESEGVLLRRDWELLDKSTKTVVELIQAASRNANEALEQLSAHTKRTRREFRKLVKTVATIEGGIGIDQAIPGRPLSRAHLTREEAMLVEALMDAKKAPTELPPFEASLVGMNVVSKRFELRPHVPIPELEDAKKISGELAAETADELLQELPKIPVGLDTRYSVTIRVALDDYSLTDESPKAQLVWLEIIE